MRFERPDPAQLAAEQCAAHACESAIEHLESALTTQPGNAELSYQIGICYSGSCRQHRLVSMPLAIAYLERAVSLVEHHAAPAVRARYLDSLGSASRSDGRPGEALSPLMEAAALYRQVNAVDDWARTEYNLGNVCCDLAEGGQSPMWNEAVQHYLASLQVRTEESNPLRFAATMQNLGTAYRQLTTGDPSTNVQYALRCSWTALRIYRHRGRGDKCADVHNNIANAYLSLPEAQRPDCRSIRRALQHYLHALEVRTRTDRPHDYAVTQFNRGQGYLRLAKCEPETARRAWSCFQEALNAFLSTGDLSGAANARKQIEILSAANDSQCL
jgi:tetratricopeptide (TPR) repeat protein